ncbi:MAG: P-loop NTPase [Fervidicoccaceae archaeon]
MMRNEDPRDSTIPIRLKEISVILPAVSYKGGVGKTTISSLLALSLADSGASVGLLDLDFTNPSTHLVLGLDLNVAMPREDKGILPVEVEGIKLMTLAFFTKNNPTPLRGKELNEAFKEILSITIWGKLDFLVIDMPPGLSDITLNVLRFMKEKLYPLVISSSSKLSIHPTINLIRMFSEIGILPIALILNEGAGSPKLYSEILDAYQKENIGKIFRIERDDRIENAYGNPDLLRKTTVYAALKQLSRDLLATFGKKS